MERQLTERLLTEMGRLESSVATLRALLEEAAGGAAVGYDLLKLLSAFDAAGPPGLDYQARLGAYASAGIDPRGAGGLFQRKNTEGYLRWSGEPGGPAILTDEGRRELGRQRRRMHPAAG